MTDVILSSLKSSSLQNSINAVSETHPFLYQLGESTVPVAQETVKIAPNSSVDPSGSQLVSFKLPGSGFLVDGYLKLSNSVGAEATDAVMKSQGQGMGLYGFDWLSLSSRDVELARFSPILLEAEACKGPNPNYNEIATGSNIVSATIADVKAAKTRDYLLPFRLLNFCGSPKDALDLQFLESLYLNANLKASSALAPNPDSTVSDLHTVLKYCKMPAESYQEYLNGNYDQNKSLTKMMWSSYTESVQTFKPVVGAGVKTFTMNLDVPNYVVSTVIKVVPTKFSDASAENCRQAGGSTAGAPVTNVVMRANGKVIVDTHGDVRANFLALQNTPFDADRTRLRSWDVTSIDAQHVKPGRGTFYEIDYRLQNLGHPSKSVDSLEGGVSMGALSSKNIEVSFYHNADFETGGEAEYKINVVHKIVNLVSIDARNGSVSVSTRS